MFQQRGHVSQEPAAEIAVDQPVIETERQFEHVPGSNSALVHPWPWRDPAYGEDG